MVPPGRKRRLERTINIRIRNALNSLGNVEAQLVHASDLYQELGLEGKMESITVDRLRKEVSKIIDELSVYK